MFALAGQGKIPVAFPSISLSTDNAAMIAAAAWPKLLNSHFADDTLEPAPGPATRLSRSKPNANPVTE